MNNIDQKIIDKAWSTTASGGHFEFFNPQPEMMHIEDIAMALSRACRYNGHLPDIDKDATYNVAQHVVTAAHLVLDGYTDTLFPEYAHIPDAAPWMFAHDHTEGWFGDMISPIKNACPLFGELEDKAAVVVRKKWNIPYNKDIALKVHKMDGAMYWLEANEMQASIPAHCKGPIPITTKLSDIYDDWRPWGTSESFDAFMDMHEGLQNMYQNYGTIISKAS